MGRAAIIDALAALVATALPGALQSGFVGKPGKPERIPSSGAVALISADPPEPEIDLNPVTYHHELPLDLAVLAPTVGQAITMVAAIGAAIASDRTLGGACDWADADGGGLDEETMAGTDGYIDARCTVTAAYTTTNPLE